ncbi:MAG: hercynine metabolism protein [Cyanobacteriota bacterium]|jgi:hercynine metabolism protein|nr:hercynine metabolism protein [Cyanobacteriota bacterium]
MAVVAGDWLEQLEARLEQQLEAFLAANPAQRALLDDQQARESQANLERERRWLQDQAKQHRQRLLALAGEIRSWRERVERARSAGAEDLAQRAESHVAGLMEQGRHCWNQLAELGQRFSAVQRALEELAAKPADQDPDLERAWAAFEAREELERLKREQGLS